MKRTDEQIIMGIADKIRAKYGEDALKEAIENKELPPLKLTDEEMALVKGGKNSPLVDAANNLNKSITAGDFWGTMKNGALYVGHVVAAGCASGGNWH